MSGGAFEPFVTPSQVLTWRRSFFTLAPYFDDRFRPPLPERAFRSCRYPPSGLALASCICQP